MDKVLGAWAYLNARLQEPSTHNAIAYLLGLAGFSLDSGIVHDGIIGLGVLFGMAGFFVKEGKPLSSS